MTVVAHTAETGLAVAFVGAGLEADLGVSALPNLLLGEIPLVLRRHLGPQWRSAVLGVLLGRSAEGVEAERDLGDVPGLEEVGRLKDLFVGHAVVLEGLLERADVLHEEEGGALLLEFLDGTGRDFVHELT